MSARLITVRRAGPASNGTNPNRYGPGALRMGRPANGRRAGRPSRHSAGTLLKPLA